VPRGRPAAMSFVSVIPLPPRSSPVVVRLADGAIGGSI
jgi:hypothetical protein